MPVKQHPKRKVTPVELAREYGVCPSKIHEWIRSGELRAINAARSPNGRPRYLIDRADILDFEDRRAVLPPEPPAPRRRRPASADVLGGPRFV